MTENVHKREALNRNISSKNHESVSETAEFFDILPKLSIALEQARPFPLLDRL